MRLFEGSYGAVKEPLIFLGEWSPSFRFGGRVQLWFGGEWNGG